MDDKPAIATFHWDGCDGCKYYADEGGCDVPKGVWEDNLKHDCYSENLLCGSFETK
ncbi:unnamed protein product [marine sediment metagenome]|uniref:Uncharacterized protein n=1 Tax=marine sediment metagenome TaxID=412755 RepID=X1AH88_9ZZZZ